MNGILPELTQRFKGLGRCAICFSGGLDSTVLLRNASESIPGEFRAVFVRLPMNSRRQIDAALKIAGSMDVDLNVLELSWDDIRGVEENGPERCYICKKTMYSKVKEFCASNGLDVIIAGENADDPESERPGFRAGEEIGVICPLKELEIGRDAVLRSVSEMSLPVDMIKDTCMATRYPVGVRIDEYSMRFVEECEETVRSVTSVKQLRVRIRGKLAVLQTDKYGIDLLLAQQPMIKEYFLERGLDSIIDKKLYENL